MRKLTAVLAAVFFIVLGFFTFFGERVYVLTHTKVDTVQIRYWVERHETGEVLAIVPRAAFVDGDCVYVTQTEEGYSFPITTLEKRSLTLSGYVSESFGDDYVCVLSGIRPGVTVVVGELEKLSDGQRVILSE